MRTLQSGMQPDDVSWEVNFVFFCCRQYTTLQRCNGYVPIQALMLAQGKGRRWEMATMNPVRILGDRIPSIRYFEIHLTAKVLCFVQWPDVHPQLKCHRLRWTWAQAFSSSVAVPRCEMQTANETIVTRDQS